MVTDAAAMAVVKAARPAFRGAHDGVAFAANAAFLAAGYSLCAVGPAALTDPPPTDVRGILVGAPTQTLSSSSKAQISEETRVRKADAHLV